MIDWIESLVLGLVQGLTEFLPISSDGHLAITQHGFEALTGRTSSSASKIFFDVMLHVGTTLAILLHYRQQGVAGAKGLLGSVEVAEPFRRNNVIRTAMLAIVATLPLIPDKLFFLDYIEKTFDSLTWIGAGFLVTAATLFVSHRLKGGEKGPLETTFVDALLVGIAQMFAPLPGVSRSGLTISAALALGFSKTWAVGFSLLMAVLAVSGAVVFEVAKAAKAVKADPSILPLDKVAQIVAAATVAGVVGYLAIVWLVRLVRAGRFWYFSVYLVLLGLGLIVVDQSRRSATDARPSPAADRSPGRPAPRPGDRPGFSLGSVDRESIAQFVDRTFGAGPRPDRPCASDPISSAFSGLVLGSGLVERRVVLD